MTDIKLRNGKTLSEALAIIGEYKEPSKFLQDKYPYYKFGEYKQRMDEAFGVGGYEAIYSGYETFGLPYMDNVVGQVLTKAECTISVFGENGAVVFRASGIGTKELGRDSNKTQYQMINNNGLFVQQAAFKSAAKSMNIFDCNSFDEEGGHEGGNSKAQPKNPQTNNKSGGSSNASKGQTQSNTPGGEKVVTLYRKKALETIREDRNSGLPVYRLLGHEVIGNSCRQKESEVILYPNCYKKDNDKMNALISNASGSYVTLRVSEGTCSDNEKYEHTFIFKGFANR